MTHLPTDQLLVPKKRWHLFFNSTWEEALEKWVAQSVWEEEGKREMKYVVRFTH